MLDKFEHYIELGKVKKKTPDSEEANSLFRKAEKRLKYIRVLDEDTADLVFEDAYEATREAAQALMSLQGFKPYSHEATISFIRDFYGKYFSEYEIAQFDRYRQLRADAVYRAVSVLKEDALKCLLFSQLFVEKIRKIMKEISKEKK